MADLDEAIAVVRQAIESTPVVHPGWASKLNNLGSKLEYQYERIGQASYAVYSTPADHSDRAAWLNNLRNKLARQYGRTGEMINLEKAINVSRQAIESAPTDHPDRTTFLHNLAIDLQSRYERTGEMANLKEATTLARQAVDSTPADHLDRAGWLNNLGNKLESRYERTGEMTNIECALIVQFMVRTIKSAAYKLDTDLFAIEGEVAEPKTHVKVFGIIMDSSLKYKEHMVRASTKDRCGQTSNLSHRERKMPNTVQYLDTLS